MRRPLIPLMYKVLPLLFLPFFAFAYISVVSKPTDQTIVIPIQDVHNSQEFFGALSGFPHTYEFEVSQQQPFKAKIFAGNTSSPKNDVSIIIVKHERRGVSEIGRTVISKQSWKKKYDLMFAESFRNGGELASELEAGTYTLEVSSPNNDNVYRLVLGTEKVKRGYMANVRALFEVKSLFRHTAFGALLSPLIFIPLIFFLYMGWFFYNKKRRIQTT